MIDSATFYNRRDSYCSKCEFWKGACLKGHKLQSPQGCPIRKFPPVDGASYAPDQPSPPATTVPEPGACCTADDGIQQMSYPEAAAHLASSIAAWAQSGFKTVDDGVYISRVAACQNGCPHYRLFQCRLCKCFVLAKAKLPAEDCPAGRWPKL